MESAQDIGARLLNAVEAGLKARADLRTARHTDAERQRVSDTETALGAVVLNLLKPSEEDHAKP